MRRTHLAVVLLGAFLGFVTQANATAYFAARSTFSPAGNDGNSGLSASVPKTETWCFANLVAGDSCTYAAGNYGLRDFAPADSGSAGNLITHQCASNWGCSFDQIVIDGYDYLLIDGMKSESIFYDSTHEWTQPRVLIYNGASNIKFTDLYARGDPSGCAVGNPGTAPTTLGCSTDAGGVDYYRFQDLVTISASNNIEFTVADGQMLLNNGNHTIITMLSDGDGTPCEANESNIWIHGTATNFIQASSERHHGVANYGACDVLFEYVRWAQIGDGRGNNTQPNGSTELTVGGTFHGANPQRQIVRYNIFSLGGSATSSNYVQQPIEMGSYNGAAFTTVLGACWAHNSHYREWGAIGSFGGGGSVMEPVTSVTKVAVLNAAIDQAWYMHTFNTSQSTSSIEEYIFYSYDFNSGQTTLGIYLDGINFRNAHGTDKVLFDGIGSTNHKTSSSDPFSENGIVSGSAIVNDTGNYFTDANGEDFTPAVGSSLIDAAVPIALTTSSGTGTTVTVTRPECFTGTMGGMRAGDVIDVNGDEVTVTGVNLSTGVLTVTPSFTHAASENVRYKPNGAIFNEIGAVDSDGGGGPPPDPPEAPTLGVLVTP